jgi:serine/threonine-protein kinase RsbW
MASIHEMDVRPTLRIAAERGNLAAIRAFVAESAASLGAAPAAVDDLIQAVDELAANAIMHGYRGRAGSLEVAVWREGSRLAVRLRDQAPPFDPTTVPPPDTTLPLEQRRPGGLGIYMSRQCVEAMIHRVTPDGGNELTLFKEAF